MAAAVQALDEIIKEYLLFRGFANTLKAFEAELKVDKDKSYRVNKIVEQLISFVQYYDLQGIRDYWSYLKRRFFSRLDSVHLQNAHKLEKCLYRFYLVNAVQTSRPDKVTDFFEKMTPELQNQTDWKEWFALPFLKSPEQNPSLDMYFSSLWQETFPLSLHNFLNAIFQTLPRLLKFDAERIISEKLKQDNNHLHKKILILQHEVSILQENKEKKLMPTAKDVEPQPKSKVASKETKPKEKETTFIQRRFRKGKDTQDKQKSPLLEQETATQTTENVQLIKTIEKTNNIIDQENRVFDKPQDTKTKTKTDSVPDVDLKVVEIESRKSRDESKLERQSSQNSSIQGLDTKLALKVDDFDSEIQFKEKRSQSFSLPKTTPRRDALKRANSNISQNNYREMSNLSTSKKTTLKEHSEEPFLVLSEEIYTEHHSPIVQCDFSPSSKMVSSVDLDGIVKVWKYQPVLSTVATVMSKSSILCTEWASKTDKVLLLGTSDGKIRLYDTETKTTRRDLSTDNQHSRIVSLACSPSGTSFVCSSTLESKSSVSSVLKHALLVEQDKQTETGQGTLLLWDLKTMKLDRRLPLTSNPARINCIAYNHNGTLLVTGGADGVIRIYDIRTSDCLMSWLAHTGQVTSVEFSVDETSVFSLGKDNQFLQWCLRKLGVKIANIVAHDGMSGPRDHNTMTMSSKAKQALFSRLFTFDCKGEHLLTCAPESGIIYKYNMSDHVLSQVFTIGESKSHVTSVDWNTAVDCITCLTGCLNGPICMTTLLKQ